MCKMKFFILLGALKRNALESGKHERRVRVIITKRSPRKRSALNRELGKSQTTHSRGAWLLGSSSTHNTYSEPLPSCLSYQRTII